MNKFAYILDFDGVLSDSLDIHLLAWMNTYRYFYGYSFPGSVDKLKRLGSQASAQYFQSLAYDNQNSSADLISYKWLELLRQPNTPPLFTGASQLLRALKTSNVPTVIASNSPTPFIKKTLFSKDLEIPMIVGRGDSGKLKPDAAVYKFCSQRLNHALDSTLVVVDDLPANITSAKSMGLTAVGIASTFAIDDLKMSGADRVFSNIFDFSMSDFFLDRTH